MQNLVCTDLGFISKGIFRIYYFDEDAGHAGLLEAGTEVATAIREFLRPLAGG